MTGHRAFPLSSVANSLIGEENVAVQRINGRSCLLDNSRIEIKIVEDHCDVIPLIYREIGAKRLPFKDLALIHFDSHPDLLIPENLQCDDVKNKNTLFESLSIENWIIPAVYAGHISTVVWVRPDWADQIPDSKFTAPYQCYVGKDPLSGTLKISCNEDYFLSSLLYCPVENMVQPAVPLKLHVVNGSQQYACYYIKGITATQKYILDIDLDYFSTLNPFRKIFSETDFSVLKNHYQFEPPKDRTDKNEVRKCLSLRKAQLETLELIVLKGAPAPDQYTDLSKVLSKNYDAETVHNAGLTFDGSELPHHVSGELELKLLFTEFSRLLRESCSSADSKPSLITIARSSLDEYCPKDQVDNIQNRAIQALEESFALIAIEYHYDLPDS